MTETNQPRDNQTAAQFFGARIPEYDDLIRRAVPGYEAITEALVAELPTGAARVLELGCGTGNLSVQLAERFPDAEITFVDASPEMLDVTAYRLAASAPAVAARATFVVRRFEELALPEHSFEVVTSAIALHHVTEKAPVYQAMHNLLQPDGRCCFADQLQMAHAASQERHWEAFLAFWRSPGHLTPAEINDLLAHSAAHDRYETVDRQFTLLRDAGFREVDIAWRLGLWGVITATA